MSYVVEDEPSRPLGFPRKCPYADRAGARATEAWQLREDTFSTAVPVKHLAVSL